MANITLIHDADIERRGDGSAPTDLDGDFMDTWLDEGSGPFDPHGTAGAHKIGRNASSKEVPAGRANGLYLYALNYYRPADAAIVSAAWHFYVYQRDNLTGATFGVDRCTRTNWVENEATWVGYREPQDNGVAEGGGNDYLDDTNKSWTTDEWAGKIVRIFGGTGTGQARTVSSNTATRLTVSPNWTTNPDNTSTYAVGDLWGTPGGDITTPSIAITTPTVGWESPDITSMVTDAWNNRNGICTFIARRTDNYATAGLKYFYHYTKNYRPTDATKPHHLRVTYTLSGKTFEAMIL